MVFSVIYSCPGAQKVREQRRPRDLRAEMDTVLGASSIVRWYKVHVTYPFFVSINGPFKKDKNTPILFPTLDL